MIFLRFIFLTKVNYFRYFFLILLENIIPIKAWSGNDLYDDSLHKIKNILQSSRGNFDVEEIVDSCIMSEV